MTYEEIFYTAKENILQYNAGKTEEHFAVEVQIEGEGEGIFYIELKDKQLFVEPYDYKNHDFRMIVSGGDLIEITKGTLDPVKAFTVGSLNIEGDIDKALQLSDVFNSIKANTVKVKKTSK